MSIKQITVKSLAVITLLLLSIGFSSSYAEPISHENTIAIKTEIKQLVDDYGYYRDSYNAVGYANVFSEDGKFTFQGVLYQGRPALEERIEAYDKNRVSMHMMSSSHIDIIDESTAKGVHYASIFAITPEEPVAKGSPISVKGPVVIGKYTDQYKLTDEGWKISERVFLPVFNTIK